MTAHSYRRTGLLAAAALLIAGLGVSVTHVAPATAQSGTLAATAGCGKSPALTSGARTIQSGGKNRTFILRIPDGYDSNRQYRLIFGFHWNGGTANDVDSGGTSGYPWSYYGLRSMADNSAIFVAPQGLNNGWANAGGEDLAFVDAMVNLIEGALCVDTTQLFSLGFSYGGGMSYAIACARATVFRAVAVYSGGQLSGCSGGTQPIAYIGLHGLRDPVLNISAGRSLRDRFVRNNGCTAQNPPEPAQGSLTHVVTYYSGCRAGYPVAWAPFDAGHTPNPWDGSAGDYNPGEKSWTRPVAWDFFNQFSSSPGPSSPGPSSPGPSSPGPSTGACRVKATVNAWNSGLTEDLTITNTGTTAINGWSVAFALPGGQTITSGWNATYSPTSGQVTARNVAYNAAIAPNASVSVGFQANHTGNTAVPTAFTLNGAVCTTA
ncbi:cellulose binding domain-containing protein [Paractinoplanes hotanensis]|uniref:Cellulose binding domain-containing protein n=1 Tax=Paractinoplanes hotanensis TaxID=2906497 RepID=A0ABT0XWD3_9ACTN|nr:cellulose binding domain-containing protein [Actinoplanes hotanensis]MCM4078100.1 cellulose binding domain-containing protein [Actinoplanes hotanensis]